MSGGRLNQVLLVGEACARLEVDLIPYGLACVWAGGATDAVAMLQKTPYGFVVVAAALPDMAGPAFVDGLLRHFDPTAAVLFGDVDQAQAQALLRSPKVTIFPGSVEGVTIANHLFQRVSGSPTTSQPPTHQPMPAPHAPASFAGGPGLGSLFDAPIPRTGAGPLPSLPPQASTWPPVQATPATHPNPARGNGAFFAAFAANPPTPAPAPVVDRGLMEKLEAIAGELGRSNAEVASLQARLAQVEHAARDTHERLVDREARLARADADNAALHAEVDAARRSAINQVAEVMALSDEGEPISAELDDLKNRVGFAEGERDNASSQLNMVREERDRLTYDLMTARQQEQERFLELDGLRRQVLEAHADIEQHRAGAETAEKALADLEPRAAAADAAVAEAEALRHELGAVRALLSEKDIEQARALEVQRHELATQAKAELEAVVELRVGQAVAEERARGTQTLAAEQAFAESKIGALTADLVALREHAQAEVAALQASIAAHVAGSEHQLLAMKAALEDEHQRAAMDAAATTAAVDAARAEAHGAAVASAVAAAVEVEQTRGNALLQAIKLELDALRAEKGEVEVAWGADQQRAAVLEANLGEEQAARLDAENALRSDLNDALKQLNEALQEAALESARADRSVADAAALRTFCEQLTHEHARIAGEVSLLRPIANDVDRARATIVDLQQQLEVALRTDVVLHPDEQKNEFEISVDATDASGPSSQSIDEAVRAQTQEIRELANALEPFAWGLQRASAFFADKNVDGAAEHVRALQLLQLTIERLRSELDRIHAA